MQLGKQPIVDGLSPAQVVDEIGRLAREQQRHLREKGRPKRGINSRLEKLNKAYEDFADMSPTEIKKALKGRRHGASED